MFKCAHCGNDSKPYEQPVRIAVDFRTRAYDKYERTDGTIDYGGDGYEIAREMIVHQSCEQDALQATGAIAKLQAFARVIPSLAS